MVIRSFKRKSAAYAMAYPEFNKIVLTLCLFQVLSCWPARGQNVETSHDAYDVLQNVNPSVDIASGLYRHIAWTEPLIIRKDYDSFRILLNAKQVGATSLSWTITLFTLEDYAGISLERDGITLHDITLFDDGTHGDEKEGDGLFTLDRLFLNDEEQRLHYGLDGDAAWVTLLDGSSEVRVAYADGSVEPLSAGQVLDRPQLVLLVLDTNVVGPSPTIWQLTDTTFATEYLMSVVVPVDTFLIQSGSGWPELLKVSKTFYAHFLDDLDFLFFDMKPLSQIQIRNSTRNATHGPVIRNDILGISLPIVNYAPLWGSSRLQQYIPGNNAYLQIVTMNHEILHRWIVNISDSLGIGGHHWGFIERRTTGFGSLNEHNGVFKSIYQETGSRSNIIFS